MTANSEIAERLRATLATELKQDVSSITREHTLRGDLGLNSLDAIELMFKLEEVFDISISDEDMQGLEKVGDVIDYLERRLSGAPVAPVVFPAAAARTVPPTPRAIPIEAPPPVKTRSTSSKPRSTAAVKHSTPAAKASAKKAKPRATRRHA
jgi:acyl carrier protein